MFYFEELESGSSSARQSAWFGTKKSQVRILSPRQKLFDRLQYNGCKIYLVWDQEVVSSSRGFSMGESPLSVYT